MELMSFKPRALPTLSEALRRLAYRCSGKSGCPAIEDLARVAFAVQGCTGREWGFCLKAIPSAGATYPLDLLVESIGVEGLEDGVYAYRSESISEHELERLEGATGEERCEFILRAVFERTTSHYGQRGVRYVWQEVGHAIQNAVVEASVCGCCVEFNIADTTRPRDGVVARLRLYRATFRGVLEWRASSGGDGGLVPLPIPKPAELGAEEAIFRRRSIRSYSGAIDISCLAYILLCSVGHIDEGLRPYPPIDGYGVDVYVVAGQVSGLSAGVYEYVPEHHALRMVREGDFTDKLCRACLSQRWVKNAGVSLVLVAERASRPRLVESGMVGQCVYLAATAIGLGTVAIGAFYDSDVAEVIGVEKTPLYVFPIGKPKL